MTIQTMGDVELLVIVEDGAPDEEWHEGRAGGVTASEIHDIANGTPATAWARILDAKLNGSTFRGNRHTQRGHDKEAELIKQCAALDGVAALGGSGALFGNLDNPAHRATPDGLGLHSGRGEFGAEVKSRNENWESLDIPSEHFDQMQWGMHVLGFGWWLYAWSVEGQEGIFHRWVPRDDARIATLVARADAFIAWRAAGAPEIDDLPDEVDVALSDYAAGLALASEGDRKKKAARAVLERFAGEQVEATGEGIYAAAGTAAGYRYEVTESDVLDEDLWREKDEQSFARWHELTARAKALEEEAARKFTKKKPTTTFRVTPRKAAA